MGERMRSRGAAADETEAAYGEAAAEGTLERRWVEAVAAAEAEGGTALGRGTFDREAAAEGAGAAAALIAPEG